jgi:hypothetical protein
MLTVLLIIVGCFCFSVLVGEVMNHWVEADRAARRDQEDRGE